MPIRTREQKARFKRLWSLRSQFKTDKDLAEAAGLQPSMLAQLKMNELHKRSRAIGEKLARDIERALRKPQYWLDSRDDENTSELPYSGAMRRIPEVSWVQAGNWSDSPDNHYIGEGERDHYTHLPVGPNAYALRVRGDSMLAPAGQSPTYPDGFVVIVDPSIDARHGADVIFRGPDDGEATFKRLEIDGARSYLKPLNPKYEMFEIDETYRYCGTVVHVGMDIR